MTFALFVGRLVASPVDVEQARQLGLKYVQHNVAKQVADLSLAHTELTEDGTAALYVFNFEGGYVIMAADDVAQPVLAFGEEGCFDANNIPDGLAYYLRHYARQIGYAVANHMEPDAEIAAQWQQMADGTMNATRGSRDINPLVTTNWNQDSPYNAYCPTGQGGPGGHAYAGCVATAMSMVLKYWNWPDHGQGSHSYTPSGYPEQSVNFEETYYQWNNMPNSVNNSNYQAVALLMYHCGVSVDMMYGGSASGAYSADVPIAIADYFRYTENTNHLNRELYELTEWEDMLIRNLEYGFPLYYSGSEPSGGHAFVCDGYRESDRKFHFNWGWSGYGNNYFAIDALNVMGSHFNENQTAIFDMIPDYVYDGLIPAAEDFDIHTANANSMTGVLTWTNPTTSLGGEALENIDQVVLLRNGVEVFSQGNVVPGEEMTFEDNVSDFDCYSYCLYYIHNGIKGRFAETSFQYGPTCTWKVIGQTSNFQGWNGGKIQVKNAFGTVIREITMTNSTPISQQVAMPEGEVSFQWVAPSTAVTSMSINIKNSSNSSVYSFTGNSNQLPSTLYSGDNDCGGCLPPTGFVGEYQWQAGSFGTLLAWDYDGEPQSFKVYRSTDGIEYQEIGTVDKTEHEYFDAVEVGTYYYKVTAFRTYCESTPAWTDGGDDFVLVEVTSVDESAMPNKLFPNPANERLCVEAEGLQQVTVYNVTGQLVYSKACDEDGVVINTAGFAEGIYTINVKTASGITTKRFAVVH